MAKDRKSRASMDHFGLRSQGAVKDAKRMVDISEERDRKTAGQETIDFYAKKNPAINPEKTFLNLDMVNDGAGGFKEMGSIDEGLAYAHGRLRRCTKPTKAGERNDAARTRDLREGTGERFLDTVVGHLPMSMCEPDGTFYQPIDPETGKGRVYKRGSRTGEPVMLARYRAKDMGEAIRYFEAFVAFQAERLPGGQSAIHAYSIQFDEGRPHIQIQADFLMDDISQKHPDGLKSGYQLAFGSHRKVKAPKLDNDGNPVLKDDGTPVMVQESGSRKMARYHTELREHMLALGYDIESEIDHARAGRRLDHEDYKELLDAQADHDDAVAEDTLMLNIERHAITEDAAAIHQDAYEAGAVEALAEKSTIDAAAVARTAALDQREAGIEDARARMLGEIGAEHQELLGEVEAERQEVAAKETAVVEREAAVATKESSIDAQVSKLRTQFIKERDDVAALRRAAEKEKARGFQSGYGEGLRSGRSDAETQAATIVADARTQAEVITADARAAGLERARTEARGEVADELEAAQAIREAADERLREVSGLTPEQATAQVLDEYSTKAKKVLSRYPVKKVEYVDGQPQVVVGDDGKPVVTNAWDQVAVDVAQMKGEDQTVGQARRESAGTKRRLSAEADRVNRAAPSKDKTNDRSFGQ